jgi:hypothetical protein
LFNATGCSGCHAKDGRGRPPIERGEAFLSMLLRLSVPGRGAHGETIDEPGVPRDGYARARRARRILEVAMRDIGRRGFLLGGGAMGALGVAASFGLSSGLAACRRASSDSPDRAQILADLTTIVIVPSYEDAATKTALLRSAVERLSMAADAPALASAQEAWRVARAAWKKTDAFLFGPADDLSSDRSTSRRSVPFASCSDRSSSSPS